MKSILYVGATLMIGASIYGFVDYNKTRNNKEFKNMYAEKEATPPVAEKKLPLVNPEKTETTVGDTKVNAGIATVSNTTVAKKNTATINKKKKRKIKREFFGRGGLEERFIGEEKLIPPIPKPKTETDKNDN